MSKTRGQRIWVAVRIERGFVSDVKAFQERELAVRQERSWRLRMNPDYDETGVAQVGISTAGSPAPPRSCSPVGSAPAKRPGTKQGRLLGHKKRKIDPQDVDHACGGTKARDRGRW